MALNRVVSKAKISALDVLDSLALVIGWGAMEVGGWEDAEVVGGWSTDMTLARSR